MSRRRRRRRWRRRRGRGSSFCCLRRRSGGWRSSSSIVRSLLRRRRRRRSSGVVGSLCRSRSRSRNSRRGDHLRRRIRRRRWWRRFWWWLSIGGHSRSRSSSRPLRLLLGLSLYGWVPFARVRCIFPSRPTVLLLCPLKHRFSWVGWFAHLCLSRRRQLPPSLCLPGVGDAETVIPRPSPRRCLPELLMGWRTWPGRGWIGSDVVCGGREAPDLVRAGPSWEGVPGGGPQSLSPLSIDTQQRMGILPLFFSSCFRTQGRGRGEWSFNIRGTVRALVNSSS